MGDSDPVEDVNLITTSPTLDIPRSRLYIGTSSNQRTDDHAHKFSLSISPSKHRPKGKPFARPSDLVNDNKLGEAVRQAASERMTWSPSPLSIPDYPRRRRKSSISSTDSVPTNYEIGQFPALRISLLQIGIAKIHFGEGMKVQLTPNNVIQLKSNDETLAQIPRSLVKAVAYGPGTEGQKDWIAFKPRGQLDVFKKEMDPASGDDVKRRIVCIASPEDIPSFVKKLHDHKFPTTVNVLTDRTASCLGVLDARPYSDVRKIPTSGMIDWKAMSTGIIEDPVRKRQRIDSADFLHTPSLPFNGQPKPRPVKPRESEDGSPAARPDLRSAASRSLETRVQAAKERGPPPDATALVYGSITLTNSDFARLETDEFYNDTIVEMYLRYIVDNVRKKQPVLADQIHIFTPFFYQRLKETGKTGIAYDLVKKWTSKVDIFSKKFLIMPINENFHWYLALIAFPGRILEFPKTLPILISPDRSRRSATRSQADFFIFDDDEKFDVTPSRASKRTVLEEEVRKKRLQTYDRSRSVATPDGSGVDKADPADSKADSKADKADSKAYVADSKDVKMASSPPAVETSSTTSVIELDKSQSLSQEIETTRSQRERKHLKALFSTPPAQPQPQPRPKSKQTPKLAPVSSPVEAVSSPVSALDERPVSPKALPSAYIIIMDSLGGKPRKVLASIHEYLLREAKDKKNVDLPPAKDWKNGYICRDIHAKVPQQGNHVDCGPYLLHYIETFFNAGEDIAGMDSDMDGDSVIADPETFAEVIAAKDDKSRWREVRALSQRERIRQALRKLKEEWQKKENNNVS